MGLPWLVSLCYHRTAEPVQNGGFDGALADATPAQFDQQVAFLAEHFRFVGVDEVAAFFREDKKLPPNPVLVTFDDGYRECRSVALPILERYGARAAFFIPTDFINERKLFWWDRVSRAVKGATRERAVLEYPRCVELDLAAAPERSTLVLLDVIKKTPKLDLDRFLAAVDEACGASFPSHEDRRIVDESLMTWEDVTALARAGMDIGSHTRSHRVLQTLDPDELDRELRGSRLELEERLGAPVTSLAYPVGYPLGSNASLRDAVRAAGYELGLTCRSGMMPTYASPDPYDVPRFLMDVSYDAAQFSAYAAIPGLAPKTTIDVA